MVLLLLLRLLLSVPTLPLQSVGFGVLRLAGACAAPPSTAAAVGILPSLTCFFF